MNKIKNFLQKSIWLNILCTQLFFLPSQVDFLANTQNFRPKSDTLVAHFLFFFTMVQQKAVYIYVFVLYNS